MAVSAGDRRFMERIGQYKAMSHADSTAMHLARPIAERLQESWSLYLEYRKSASVHLRRDDPSTFYERARRLGLYSSQN